MWYRMQRRLCLVRQNSNRELGNMTPSIYDYRPFLQLFSWKGLIRYIQKWRDESIQCAIVQGFLGLMLWSIFSAIFTKFSAFIFKMNAMLLFYLNHCNWAQIANFFRRKYPRNHRSDPKMLIHFRIIITYLPAKFQTHDLPLTFYHRPSAEPHFHSPVRKCVLLWKAHVRRPNFKSFKVRSFSPLYSSIYTLNSDKGLGNL
jgi:hypothetical protein